MCGLSRLKTFEPPGPGGPASVRTILIDVQLPLVETTVALTLPRSDENRLVPVRLLDNNSVDILISIKTENFPKNPRKRLKNPKKATDVRES